jgi:hypothetical protein
VQRFDHRVIAPHLRGIRYGQAAVTGACAGAASDGPRSERGLGPGGGAAGSGRCPGLLSRFGHRHRLHLLRQASTAWQAQGAGRAAGGALAKSRPAARAGAGAPRLGIAGGLDGQLRLGRACCRHCDRKRARGGRARPSGPSFAADSARAARPAATHCRRRAGRASDAPSGFLTALMAAVRERVLIVRPEQANRREVWHSAARMRAQSPGEAACWCDRNEFYA